MQAHECGADQTTLKSEPGRERFGDDGVRRRIFHGVGAVFLRVEFFIRRGDERREADAAGGIAAGILKLAHLLGEFRLAGTHCGDVQRKNVVKNARDDLQPFALGAAEFFHFQPERAFFG